MSTDSALGWLLNLLKEKAGAFKNLKTTAKDELGYLMGELTRLQAHLKDADEMEQKTHVFRENEKQIRNLVYEVEDTIEYCLTKNTASANTKNVWRKVKTLMSSQMEHRVKDLRENRVAEALKLIPPSPEQPRTDVDKMQEMGSSDVESKYRKLEGDMKACFLYTGLFPRGYEIPASTLTQLWIAERFIQQVKGKTLEQSAEEVLKHLINEELLKAGKMRLEQVKTCKVDDIIREFCIKKAEELNLFTVFEPSVDEEPLDWQSFYRLSFHSDPSNILSDQQSLMNGPHVRSFLCLQEEPLGLHPGNMSTVPNAFKPLRVLNCEATVMDKLPDIRKLVLLKHVTLFIKKLDFLPAGISNLLNLQTLIVKTNSDYIKVKANIWKMMQLRHLKTKVSFILDDKKWNGRAAKTLQTLSRLSPESCTEDLHEKAPNLKKLGIRGKLADLFEKFSLKNFSHLENLTMENYVEYGPEYMSPLKGLCNLGLSQTTNLKKLSLSKTYLHWNTHMEELAKINTLEVLKVKDNAFNGAVWNVRSGFPKLRYLLIENTDLNTWTASTDQFPQLEWLVIKKCRLEKLPDSLNHVKLELVE